MNLPEFAQMNSEGIGGAAMESKGRTKQEVTTALTKLEEDAEFGSVLGLALGRGDGSNRGRESRNWDPAYGFSHVSFLFLLDGDAKLAFIPETRGIYLLKLLLNLINFSRSASVTKNPSACTQLTIFYNGTVNVFDAISPEKAQAIMFIAAAAAASSGNNMWVPSRTDPSPTLTRSLSQQSSSTAPSPQIPQLPINSSPYLCKLQTELPVARRHSLQRFLEKRRDRFVSRAPYGSEKNLDAMEVIRDPKPGVN